MSYMKPKAMLFGYPRAQRGMSLIELMVAVAISLLIMVAILQLYLDITRTNDEMAKTNAQIENGRFAIQLLQDDIAHAGFWAGYVPFFDDLTSSDVVTGTPPLVTGTPRAVPDPCLADVASASDEYKDNILGIPVQVFGAALTGCTMTGLKSGTNVLVVRHASLDTGCVGPATCFQTTFCAAEMPAYWLGSGATNTLRGRDCTTVTGARRYISNIYYIREDAGIPTLMRLEFGNPTPQPLIEGVEDFRVELGIDDESKTGEAVDYSVAVDFGTDPADRTNPTNRGDGVPDRFISCPSADCTDVDVLANVVAVKLYVLVRNLQPTPGYQDLKSYCLGSSGCPGANVFTPSAAEQSYKRHLFTSTVRLNNVSSRRETP